MNNEKIDWRQFRSAFILIAVVLVAMFVVSFYAWQRLPAGGRIAVHWGVNGQPDRYGSKFEGLLLIPLMTLGIAGIMLLMPLIEPRRLHLKLSLKAYIVIISAIIVLMLGLYLITVLHALGWQVNVMRSVCVGVGVLFILIGNYLGKIRSTFFFGIRTPWTLSSELAWDKTHRLGGRLFAVIGLILALGSFVFTGKMVFIFLITALAILLITITVYSYLIWRSDPAKKQAGN